jgi:hypothetical protein
VLFAMPCDSSRFGAAPGLARLQNLGPPSPPTAFVIRGLQWLVSKRKPLGFSTAALLFNESIDPAWLAKIWTGHLVLKSA